MKARIVITLRKTWTVGETRNPDLVAFYGKLRHIANHPLFITMPFYDTDVSLVGAQLVSQPHSRQSRKHGYSVSIVV